MKNFKLSKEMRGLQYSALAFTTYFALRGEPLRGSMIFTYALWVLSCWMVFLKTYRIEIDDNGTIRFKKLIGTVTVKPQDVLSVTDHLKFDVIRYRGGSVSLDPFIENLGEFKSILKALNSEIVFDESSWIASRNVFRVLCEISVGLLVFLAALYLGIIHFLGKP